MTIALLAALVVLNVAYIAHLERKDKRHDRQVNRLLLWRHEPMQAAQGDAPRMEGPLYVPSDDSSWLLNQEKDVG